MKSLEEKTILESKIRRCKKAESWLTVALSSIVVGGLIKLGTITQDNQGPEYRKTIPRNTLDMSTHACKEIATDVDYDGRIDVVTRNDPRGSFVFYKKGYGPSQAIPGVSLSEVTEDFFESYDLIYGGGRPITEMKVERE